MFSTTLKIAASALSLCTSIILFPLTKSIKSSAIATNEYEDFLQEKYHIHITSSIDTGEYLRCVAQILPNTKQDYEHYFTNIRRNIELSPWDAAIIAVRASGLQELAQTYSTSKTNAALALINSETSDWCPHTAQELATALDTGIISSPFYNLFKHKQKASIAFLQHTLIQIACFNGQYKKFIGYASDMNLISELISSYEASDLIEIDELQAVVDEVLQQNLITGYSIKDSRYEPNFVDSYRVTYGHADIKHAIQLIGLLRGAGLEAKIQYEPKTSAFVYLKQWGEPIQNNSYKVRQLENGNYIAYCKEYDISFEFESMEQKSKFLELILAFAKKDEEDEPSLLYGSWWQPLYYSNAELNDFNKISSNIISYGNNYAQMFTLTKQADSIANEIKKIDASLLVENKDIWVNKAFFHYLEGADYK